MLPAREAGARSVCYDTGAVGNDDWNARIGDAVATLEALVEEPLPLAEVDEELRRRLQRAAGALSRPDRDTLRKVSRARRRKRREARKQEDERVLDETGIRTLRRAPVFAPALEPPSDPDAQDNPRPSALEEARKCYVCKALFVEVHEFYDQLCPPCAALNWERRHRSADLSGRVALVTGARVKIGYQAALKLLRAGARVVATTRFPHDAANRYAREPDFASFAERLDIHGVDLRHTPSVTRFADFLAETLPRLDYLLNNACQTVRRPAGFYRHLMDGEAERRAPSKALPLLAQHDALRQTHPLRATADRGPGSELPDSAALSQAALLPEDRPGALPHAALPEGHLDADLQQVDLRVHHSWRLLLHEVPTVELLEVQLVNAVAPFILNARLRTRMAQTPARDKHIVNVSAMEGQFYRKWKTARHPHTNMAKAALNMMTRTAAPDYVRDGIHMNSVDTGWVTDEDPHHLAQRKTEEHGFHPPLDIVDGAARIVDPIFEGLATGEPPFGLFFKDYTPCPW